MKRKPVSQRCTNYRERITECRRCDISDAPFKICFNAKKEFKGRTKMGIVDVE
jgi:hypothetical protein